MLELWNPNSGTHGTPVLRLSIIPGTAGVDCLGHPVGFTDRLGGPALGPLQVADNGRTRERSEEGIRILAKL